MFANFKTLLRMTKPLYVIAAQRKYLVGNF